MSRFITLLCIFNCILLQAVQDKTQELQRYVRDNVPLDPHAIVTLLGNGAQIGADNNLTVAQAILNRNPKWVEFLLSHGAYATNDALALAVLRGEAFLVEILVKKSITSLWGEAFDRELVTTLLHYAQLKKLQNITAILTEYLQKPSISKTRI